MPLLKVSIEQQRSKHFINHLKWNFLVIIKVSFSVAFWAVPFLEGLAQKRIGPWNWWALLNWTIFFDEAIFSCCSLLSQNDNDGLWVKFVAQHPSLMNGIRLLSIELSKHHQEEPEAVSSQSDRESLLFCFSELGVVLCLPCYHAC